MRQLFLFYRGDLIESICEDSESASKEESYLESRGKPCRIMSVIAPTIDSCWDRLNEFDGLGLHPVGSTWEIVP